MADQLSITFAALSDPTRRAILARLALGETSVKELARPFSITAPSITKHLKVLERAGLIRRSREAQWRPCRLEAAPLKDVSQWIERYRQFWEQSLSRLDDYLSKLETEETKRHARKKQRWSYRDPSFGSGDCLHSHISTPTPVLFEAWTKPEHVRHWWGCDGSSLTVCDIDFRVGGAWHFLMRMPDGSDHPFKGVYRDIVQDERLVYSECYDVPQIGSPEWLTTVTFEDIEEGTRLTHTILHRSREARDGHLQAGMEAGTIQTMRRLDEHAARTTNETVRC
jgi:uncharacterized protein YndB with AHSA1/START domain/DNA-binding transcriptional ArsR family regulator